MKIVTSYAWNSHKPLLISLVNVVNPGFILELGMGAYSTPVFLNSKCSDIMFIDNNAEWLDYAKKNYVFDDRHEVLFHDLGLNCPKFLRELAPQKRAQIVQYYKELSGVVAAKSGTPKMMFVDNHACCRALAINTLYNNFDVIAYHDCELLGVPWYEYYFENELKKQFYHYTLKTPRSWTGCFIRNELKIGLQLESEIKQHILKYSSEVDEDPNKIYLVKGY